MLTLEQLIKPRSPKERSERVRKQNEESIGLELRSKLRGGEGCIAKGKEVIYVSRCRGILEISKGREGWRLRWREEVKKKKGEAGCGEGVKPGMGGSGGETWRSYPALLAVLSRSITGTRKEKILGLKFIEGVGRTEREREKKNDPWLWWPGTMNGNRKRKTEDGFLGRNDSW